MIKFGHPWLLLLLLIIPLYLVWELKFNNRRRNYLPHSRVKQLRFLSHNQYLYRYLFPVLRALIIFFLCIAIAEPRWGTRSRDLSNKGVDIIMAIDISGSMLAMDFAPQNRLSAAVSVAKDFVKKRPNDRFGLVAFSEYALTQVPLTFDHLAMLNSLEKLKVNEEASATALGMGLAKAVARLKNSTAKSRVIILITDGVNNTGEIDPLTAAEMAKELGIKVYPIGVGSKGLVPFPYSDPVFGTRYINTLIDLDMETLNKIATTTGTGKAALATDAKSLADIMNKIDRLEKTQFTTQFRYNYSEQFMPFLWLAFIFLAIELLLKTVILPILPDQL
ncbi:MAG TPA: VWA domain-containing protein [Candidatus Cloacimonas sp.]|nr:VWA domain-containing protein [Candidatus Cloacimonas sp.]MDD4676446.1 VWA domain-containing protein [Candidatus Cloacimonadota bacterium]HNZ33204.1 VWA domain-containing protein [Candidatus Cloacimonas sp.]HOG26651.1 VWA domain-containing protein [Candidatus Cloacimonas sp.]HOQ77366.1 VWA domain-containing protein [Candidatus Cloacimonas sp.]